MRFAPYGGILSRAVEQDDPLHGPKLAIDVFLNIHLPKNELSQLRSSCLGATLRTQLSHSSARGLFLRVISAYTYKRPSIRNNNNDQRCKARAYFCSVIAIGDISMNFDQDRQRAERNLKKEERVKDGREAMIDYEAQAVATCQKTARLKALRLAKEAQAQTEVPAVKQIRQRPREPQQKAAH
jgi:hypothetical protein